MPTQQQSRRYAYLEQELPVALASQGLSCLWGLRHWTGFVVAVEQVSWASASGLALLHRPWHSPLHNESGHVRDLPTAPFCRSKASLQTAHLVEVTLLERGWLPCDPNAVPSWPTEILRLMNSCNSDCWSWYPDHSVPQLCLTSRVRV